MCSPHFHVCSLFKQRGGNFCDFMLASLVDEAPPKMGLLINERISFLEAIFFHKQLTSMGNGNKMKMAEFLPNVFT